MKTLYGIDMGRYCCEVILINDGSSDSTGILLEKMKLEYPSVHVIHFPRNFGQQQGLMAGIQAAQGEVMITIDLDLQQPPDLIPSMIQLYEDGYQVVHAIPTYHHSATLLKRLTSKIYYRWIKWMGAEGVVYKSNEFRLISHSIAAVLRKIPESNLYIRGIIAWLCPLGDLSDKSIDEIRTWRSTTIPYIHQPRAHGKTKYTWFSLAALALDGVTSTSIQPLRFGLFLGMGSIGLATGLAVWALYMHLVAGQTVSGWTSLMIVILFFSSIQFLLMGLIGEYIGKIFLQVRDRPGHIIDDANYQHKRNEWTLPKHHKSENSKSIS